MLMARFAVKPRAKSATAKHKNAHKSKDIRSIILQSYDRILSALAVAEGGTTRAKQSLGLVWNRGGEAAETLPPHLDTLSRFLPPPSP